MFMLAWYLSAGMCAAMPFIYFITKFIVTKKGFLQSYGNKLGAVSIFIVFIIIYILTAILHSYETAREFLTRCSGCIICFPSIVLLRMGEIKKNIPFIIFYVSAMALYLYNTYIAQPLFMINILVMSVILISSVFIIKQKQ